MKLATLKNDSRDGQLVVVSQDGTVYKKSSIATMQEALDSWDSSSEVLKKEYDALCADQASAEKFVPNTAMAPLPRAYEWVDGSAFIHHIVLVRKARGAEPPETLRTSPLVYQGGSGIMLGARDDIFIEDTSWGLDFESEVAVVLGDTPQGTVAKDAHKYVKLVMLCNDVSLRGLIPEELKKNFGFFNSKPASAFSPLAVTPDELGESWKDGRLHLDMVTHYNDKQFGNPNAGSEMFFSFYQLIEHICRTRSFTAGTILGSGTVSNEDRARGSSCLAEKRMIEKIDNGEFKTPFMKPGDRVQIEMFDKDQKSIFGQIDQKVVGTKK